MTRLSNNATRAIHRHVKNNPHMHIKRLRDAKLMHLHMLDKSNLRYYLMV